MKLQSKVMLKYSLYTITRTRLRANLYAITKNCVETNTTKIDGITFRGGAHTQQGSRKLILNLTRNIILLQILCLFYI